MPPCFQWVTLSLYDLSRMPSRSFAVLLLTAAFLISFTKLGHAPFSRSSSIGVLPSVPILGNPPYEIISRETLTCRWTRLCFIVKKQQPLNPQPWVTKGAALHQSVCHNPLSF